MKKNLLVLFVYFLTVNSFAQTFPGIQYLPNYQCPGTRTFDMSTFGQTFTSSNHFIVELSDANGSFVSPVVIADTLRSDLSQITAQIPQSIPKGTGYLLRVRSTSPAMISTTSNVFSINDRSIQDHSISILAGSLTFCYGGTVKLAGNNNSSAVTYTWSNGNTNAGNGYYQDFDSTQSVYYTGIDKYGCPLYSDTVQVIEWPEFKTGYPDTMEYCPDHIFNLEIKQKGKAYWSIENTLTPVNQTKADSLSADFVLYKDSKIFLGFEDVHGCRTNNKIQFVESPTCHTATEDFKKYFDVNMNGVSNNLYTLTPHIETDNNGNTYVSGNDWKSTKFADSAISFPDQTGWGSYILKYGTNHSIQWLLSFHNTNGSYPSIDIRFKNGNLYALLFGSGDVYLGDSLFSWGTTNYAYLIKLDPSTGKVMWTRRFDINSPYYNNAMGSLMDVNNNGNIVLGLMYAVNSTLYMDGVSITSSTNGYPGAIVELDSDGKLKWITDIESGNNSNALKMYGVKYSPYDNSVYFAGEVIDKIIINKQVIQRDNQDCFYGKLKNGNQLDWLNSAQDKRFIQAIAVSKEGDFAIGHYVNAYFFASLIYVYDRFGKLKFSRLLSKYTLLSLAYDKYNNLYGGMIPTEMYGQIETRSPHVTTVSSMMRGGIIKFNPEGKLKIVKGEVGLTDISDIDINDSLNKISFSARYKNGDFLEKDSLKTTHNNYNNLYTSTALTNYEYFEYASDTICKGDSIFLAGKFQTKPGIYSAIKNSSTTGYDSILRTKLNVTIVDVAVTNSVVSLTAHANGATYQWLNCSDQMPVSNGTAQIYYPSAAGSFKVKIKQNGCADVSACYSLLPTSMTEISGELFMNIYPNPTTADLTVDIRGVAKSAQLKITSLTGQILYNEQLSSLSDLTSRHIHLKKFAKGMYLVSIEEEGKIVRMKKLIVN